MCAQETVREENENIDGEPECERTEEKKVEDKEKNEQEDFKAKFYYLAAEMDNMKKRYDREKDGLIKYGNERILKSLIEVIDNFDHTINALKKDDDDKVKVIFDGIMMIRTQFFKTLEQYGLTTVKTVGEIFDPHFHEAMSQIAAEGKKQHEIINEFQKGYTLHGRLVRAAKVVIVNNE